MARSRETKIELTAYDDLFQTDESREEAKLSKIFNEYLSSVVANLSKENEEYKDIQDKIESLYQQYPKVLGVFDTEQAAELTKEECAAVIKVMELKNRLTDMEMQSVYFRGCYDSVGYLKKAGIL